MAGIVDKFKRMWDAPDDEYEYDEYGYGEEPEENFEEDVTVRDNTSRRSKVVNINATAKLAVALFKPERFGEETRAIADELIKTHTVVLNLEETPREIQRRIVDFLSGAAYANGGNMRKVAKNTFIIVARGVDVMGELMLEDFEDGKIYF